ncbi:hypothetical protein XAP412_730078 [Xanthomonas phaseoli pv. phaseoli]|uniref:Uncharacterized protein n=1 Tax=Xanthomonas campestris pv. phaseoli TaxID=317013 RepID=A0AB38E6I3_XANCH|nr:hypothetical protein XAP412_730078 [Xanthomonas phaseoli pv. phaseoli]SON92257.1 hypothetical protein XAP7430_730078 [Xanthomonas phaseoli pv. phaseoli]
MAAEGANITCVFLTVQALYAIIFRIIFREAKENAAVYRLQRADGIEEGGGIRR